MAAWNCGWCGQFGEMKPTDDWRITPQSSYERFIRRHYAAFVTLYSLFVCANCDAASMGASEVNRIESDFSSVEGRRSFWRQNSPDKWYPVWIETPDFKGLSEHIEGPVKEAYETNANGFYRASVILARAVIEAVAKEKKADGRDLYHRIEKLFELDLITPLTKSAAHVVRNSGNDMAHGDFDEKVDRELADATLDFMGFVLNDVYVAPAKVQAMEAKLKQSKTSKVE